MNKIKQVLKHGWQVHMNECDDGWYDVGFEHNSYGEVSAIKDNLADAINECYSQVKALYREYAIQW